jgi:hypothetical protein
MPKKAVSITLDEANLLWLKGRARVLAGGSLSEAVDQLIDEARAGRLGAAEPARSVAGTIDVPDDDALKAGAIELSELFAAAIDRPPAAPQQRPPQRAPKARKK